MHNKKRVHVLAWQGIDVHAEWGNLVKTRALKKSAVALYTRETRCFEQSTCNNQPGRELVCTRNEMFSKKRVYPAARQGFDLHAKCSNIVKPRVLEKSGGNWHARGMRESCKNACIAKACHD